MGNSACIDPSKILPTSNQAPLLPKSIGPNNVPFTKMGRKSLEDF